MAEQLEDSQIEAIARALGHTGEGLSGTEFEYLLAAAKITDVGATSENMLRLRLLTDASARVKNGDPVHSTRGVARKSWNRFKACWATRRWRSRT